MLWILWAIPSALANRIRGGWLMNYIKKVFPFWATTPARLFVSAVISIPVFITQPWRVSALFYVLLYLGFVFAWAPWQFMINPKKDILVLTARGLLLTIPSGFVCDLYWFALSGCLMGLVYWMSYKLPFKYKQEDGYVWSGSDWGELIFGGVLGLFIGINIFLLKEG